MKVACLYLAFNLLILASSFASAYDPSLLQDFCVAVNDTNNGVFVNGSCARNQSLQLQTTSSFQG
ncbi:hypothetical protein Godav_028067 [Gossypium davidsonii]|uniref:Uncharacterized protein n=1 Tax=Gossypium davidsonii TaxID=34287 RepID=A0A7J8RY73_GOSDV|nr:hypothetical protein [Gossypium davidsonii]